MESDCRGSVWKISLAVLLMYVKTNCPFWELYSNRTVLLKWVVTVAQRCVSIGTNANLLSSILTISLTCPNNDTVFCYSNDPFLTVCTGLVTWIQWVDTCGSYVSSTCRKYTPALCTCVGTYTALLKGWSRTSFTWQLNMVSYLRRRVLLILATIVQWNPSLIDTKGI